MLGYMLSNDQLNENDLSGPLFKTSIESLCESNRNEGIRGYTSFGTMFERHGLGIAYPSLANPKPESRIFYSGGHIIRNYSAMINAIQVELPSDIRTGKNKLLNAQLFARTLVEYMKTKNLLMSN